MNEHFRKLAAEADRTRQAAAQAQATLDHARSQCSHQWGEAKYDPIVQEGYRTQDLMGPFHVRQDGTLDAPEVYVPRSETPRWTRTCLVCGYKQHTQQTTEHVTRTPKF